MTELGYKYDNETSFIEYFCKERGTTSIIFNRMGYTNSFVNLFHKIFKITAQSYEENNGICEPYYSDFVSFSINGTKLGLNDEKLYFTIKSFHAKELKYLSNVPHDPNQIKDSMICDVIFGNSIDTITKLYEYMKSTTIPSSKNMIYNWDNRFGQYVPDSRKTYDKSIRDLFGLDQYFEMIVKDLDRYNRHKKTLIKLGASNGLNYMVYGTPGSGKTSFIRSIASELGLPLCVAKLTMAANENQVTNMLIPHIANNANIENLYVCGGKKEQKTKTDFMIVLIEDFDRYLEQKGSGVTMSAVLNALDGIYPAFNVIRFFSANNPDIIKTNGALVTRMNRVLLFGYPNQDQIKNLVLNAFDVNGHELLDSVVDELHSTGLSMRQFTHYICRFLDSENPLQDILDGKKEWIDNINKFNDYKESVKEEKKDTGKISTGLINPEMSFAQVMSNYNSGLVAGTQSFNSEECWTDEAAF